MPFLFKYKHIKAKTIAMQKPVVLADGTVQRKAVTENKLHNDLILKENTSRRAAYKNTTIQTSEAFFDDSDMISDYRLIVIYDQKANVPLLTARYYYDKTVIAKCLKGDGDSTENIMKLDEKHIFLSDRLSGNTNSVVYRRYRSYIFLLFYLEILTYNTKGEFILMARKEKHDKLLKKYLSIGLNVIDSNTHKGKEHWILLGDVKDCQAKLKLSPALKLLLMIKKLKRNFN